MAPDSLDPIPLVSRPALEQHPFVLDTGAPTHNTRAATPEEVRAVEALFAQQDRESASVVNLMSAYGAGMLLHDLVKDTFTREGGEDEPDEAPKKKPRISV